jgi:PAS domain-containing protein
VDTLRHPDALGGADADAPFVGRERLLFDALPAPTLLMDARARIVAANRASLALLGPDRGWLRRAAGDALHCLNAEPAGCGEQPACADCVIRSCVARVHASGTVVRERTALALRDGRGLREVWLLVSGSPLEHRGVRHALVTLEDVTELVRARSLLPMCAHCRRLRSDTHYWMTVEEYLKEHHDVDVSHGLCLDCARDVHGLAWNGE